MENNPPRGGLLAGLTVSVLFHSLLLWPVAVPRLPGRAEPAPLAATLRPAALPEALPAAPPTPPREAAPAPRRAAVPQRAAAAVAEPLSAAVGVPSPVAPAPATAGESAPSAPAAGAATFAEEVAPDAEGMRRYRIGLAREARGHRRYPPLALERGWTGTAEVEVGVSRQGRARGVLLARSSGHDILDREALAMMSLAAAAVVPPESLRGREFSVRLPVVFDLEDGETVSGKPQTANRASLTAPEK